MQQIILKSLSYTGGCTSRRFLSQFQHQLANISDPVQKGLMAEKLMLVDRNDNFIRSESKLDCHTVGQDGSLKLHRGLSVFLFNSSGKLLLTQRSEHKVTFPLLWTNTCCSHPLFIDSEKNGIEGIKVASLRRLEYELGITDLELKDLDYLTRYHYMAKSDDKWGEHEIGYICFVKKDVKVDANKNEIGGFKYVSLEEVSKMDKTSFTPWFRLILESKLPEWWSALDCLQKYRDHTNILRLALLGQSITKQSVQA